MTTNQLNKKEFSEKNILLTGASSGIGLQAAKILVTSNNNLILPCRNEETAKFTLKHLSEQIGFDQSKLDFPIIDLSNLLSVKEFAQHYILNDKRLDILILNAGLQYTGSKLPRWSRQKIELTFAVNHLAHHYLANSLLPLLLKSDQPRLVVTASAVHNPQAPGGQFGKPAGLGEMTGIRSNESFLMIDGSTPFSADKAYKDSKLCNILFAKEFSRRLSLYQENFPVIAWAPGLVIPRGDGGFFRYSKKYNQIGQVIFSFFVRDLFRITERPENAGKLLADLALEREFNSNGFHYYSNNVQSPGVHIFKECDCSEEANNTELAKELWELSEKLLSVIN